MDFDLNTKSKNKTCINFHENEAHLHSLILIQYDYV